MRIQFRTEVEYDGGRFYFIPQGREFILFQNAIVSETTRTGKLFIPAAEVGVETQLLALEFCESSIVDWEGVLDGGGNEIPFSREALLAVDPLDKVLLAYGFFAARELLKSAIGAPASPPMNSAPLGTTEGS